MSFQLIIMRGRSATKVHRIGTGATVVGRQDGCQLQIKSSQVSRRHCELTIEGDRLRVKDLGSSNGTFVNGRKVSEEQALAHGDELTIGTVVFRVQEAGKPLPQQVAAPAAAAVATPSPPRTVAPPSDDDAPIPLGDDDVTVMATRSPPPALAESGVEMAEPVEIGEDAVAEFLLDLDEDETP